MHKKSNMATVGCAAGRFHRGFFLHVTNLYLGDHVDISIAGDHNVSELASVIFGATRKDHDDENN